jgi:hypothetical protein
MNVLLPAPGTPVRPTSDRAARTGQELAQHLLSKLLVLEAIAFDQR